MQLTFSEAVNFSSVLVDGITLLDSRNTTNETVSVQEVTLDSASLTMVTSLTELTILLTDTDLNMIKAFPEFASDESNTFLLVAEGGVADFAGNLYNTSDTIQAIRVDPDNTNPELVSYEFNLNASLLTLLFSETVNGSSLDVTGLTFQGEEIYRTGQRYTLVSSQTESVNSPVITIQLSTEDTNSLKQLPDVANDISSTFLVVRENTVLDTSGNPISPISDIMARRTQLYVADRILSLIHI